MKKSLVCILLISCLMMALSIPAFAADTGIAPYGTPGSGYDQKSFMFNGQEYTAYFYLQFDTSSYRAKSKCYTEALVDVTHNSLKVQFQTQGSGYQIRTGGSISYTATQRSTIPDKPTYSRNVIYTASNDVATGVNYIGGSATFNGNINTSATLGFLK